MRNINLYLISNNNDFYLEKCLFYERILPKLNECAPMVFISSIDLLRGSEKYPNQKLVNESVYYRAPLDINIPHTIYLLFISDDYGFVPDEAFYKGNKLANNLKNLPEEPISLIEYQSRLAGIFDDPEKQFFVFMRNFANRPDFKGNKFVDLVNHEKLRKFRNELFSRENVEIFDYPSWLDSESTYNIREEDAFVNAVCDRLKFLLDKELSKIVTRAVYPGNNVQILNYEKIKKEYFDLIKNKPQIKVDRFIDSLFLKGRIETRKDIGFGRVNNVIVPDITHYDEYVSVFLKEYFIKEKFKVCYFDVKQCVSDDNQYELLQNMSMQYDGVESDLCLSYIDYFNSKIGTKDDCFCLIINNFNAREESFNILNVFSRHVPMNLVIIFIKQAPVTIDKMHEITIAALGIRYDEFSPLPFEHHYKPERGFYRFDSFLHSVSMTLPLSRIPTLKSGVDFSHIILNTIQVQEKALKDPFATLLEFSTFNFPYHFDEVYTLFLIASSKVGMPLYLIDYLFTNLFDKPFNLFMFYDVIDTYRDLFYLDEKGYYHCTYPLDNFLSKYYDEIAFGTFAEIFNKLRIELKKACLVLKINEVEAIKYSIFNSLYQNEIFDPARDDDIGIDITKEVDLKYLYEPFDEKLKYLKLTFQDELLLYHHLFHKCEETEYNLVANYLNVPLFERIIDTKASGLAVLYKGKVLNGFLKLSFNYSAFYLSYLFTKKMIEESSPFLASNAAYVLASALQVDDEELIGHAHGLLEAREDYFSSANMDTLFKYCSSALKIGYLLNQRDFGSFYDSAFEYVNRVIEYKRKKYVLVHSEEEIEYFALLTTLSLKKRPTIPLFPYKKEDYRELFDTYSRYQYSKAYFYKFLGMYGLYLEDEFKKIDIKLAALELMNSKEVLDHLELNILTDIAFMMFNDGFNMDDRPLGGELIHWLLYQYTSLYMPSYQSTETLKRVLLLVFSAALLETNDYYIYYVDTVVDGGIFSYIMKESIPDLEKYLTDYSISYEPFSHYENVRAAKEYLIDKIKEKAK